MTAQLSRLTEPQLESSALVTIDVQSDVLDGQPLEIPGSSRALGAIVPLAEAFRSRGLPIVHIVRLYRSDASNVDLCRREAVIGGWQALAPDSAGSQLPRELLGERWAPLRSVELLAGEVQALGDGEVVMYKPRWGAFFQTPLHEHLARAGVTTIALCGFNFPNCPRTSIYEASERDFRVVAVTDAISGLYARGRDELAAIGVALMSAGEVTQQLPAAGALLRS
jgi:nicotinamidase-related amidase